MKAIYYAVTLFHEKDNTKKGKAVIQLVIHSKG